MCLSINPKKCFCTWTLRSIRLTGFLFCTKVRLKTHLFDLHIRHHKINYLATSPSKKMKLVILESPRKTETVKKYLPNDYVVLASMGHILEIPTRGLNVTFEDGMFRAKYQVHPSKQDTVRLICGRAKVADEVLLCTDPDREGERIAYDLAQLINAPEKIKRVTFHEITKKVVTNAFKKPRDIDLDLVGSQMARQVLDRLIGYMVSPKVWRNVRGGKSAGRVQSVALRLVAEREFEIENFEITSFWDAELIFTKDGQTFPGRVIKNDKPVRITDPAKAEMLMDHLKAAGGVGEIISVEKKERIVNPSAPFDTASLQKVASSKFGWTGKKIMQIAQELYEQGLITYHRTDSFAISDEAVDACREYVRTKKGEEYVPEKPHTYSKKSRSQEAHECIRPTSFEGAGLLDSSSLSNNQKKLLNLIRRRFISCQMSPAVYQNSTVQFRVNQATVLVKGRVLDFAGWTDVWPVNSKEIELPPLKKGEKVEISEINLQEHRTKPPDRYNDGTVVSKMEKAGVGRPSTWATLVDTLIKRGYITRQGKNFHLTTLGRRVYLYLMSEFADQFMDIDYTSKVEEELDRISNGEIDKDSVVNEFYEALQGALRRRTEEQIAAIFGED